MELPPYTHGNQKKVYSCFEAEAADHLFYCNNVILHLSRCLLFVLSRKDLRLTVGDHCW